MPPRRKKLAAIVKVQLPAGAATPAALTKAIAMLRRRQASTDVTSTVGSIHTQ